MDLNTETQRDRFSFKRLVRDWYRLLVISPVFAWQEWKCARARAYLLTHDVSYRFSRAGIELIRQREELYKRGVSPDDPRIPNRLTIEQELPPMKWPHTDRMW